jgi:exopolyphosphatase/pppGpp-phosphohydrolase
MMDRGEKELRDEHVEGHVIERSRLEELRRRAAAMSPKQRVARLGLPPQRADIQIAGLAIVEAALDRLGIGAARTSRYALRHGVLRSIAPKEA